MKESKTNYVICGLPDSGQKELYTLLKDNLSKKYSFNESGLSILDNSIKEDTINFNLFDLTRIEELQKTTKFIICVRDIRDILCDKFIFNDSKTYVNDWNCRYMFDDLIMHDLIINSTTSFGLRYYADFIKNLSEEQKLSCIIITYEQLIVDPITTQLELMEFDTTLDFESDFTITEIRRPTWENNLERMKDQVCKFPKMIDYITYFNFEQDNSWCDGIYDEEQVQTNEQNIKLEIDGLIKTSLTSVAPVGFSRHNKIKRPFRNQLNVRKNKIGRSKPTIQAKKKIKNQVNIKFNTSK